MSVGEASQFGAATGSTPGCSRCLETGNETACWIFKIKDSSLSVEYTSTIEMKDSTFLRCSHNQGQSNKECKFEVMPNLICAKSITLS